MSNGRKRKSGISSFLAGARGGWGRQLYRKLHATPKPTAIHSMPRLRRGSIANHPAIKAAMRKPRRR